MNIPDLTTEESEAIAVALETLQRAGLGNGRGVAFLALAAAKGREDRSVRVEPIDKFTELRWEITVSELQEKSQFSPQYLHDPWTSPFEFYANATDEDLLRTRDRLRSRALSRNDQEQLRDIEAVLSRREAARHDIRFP